jgi:hypothetical protein
LREGGDTGEVGNAAPADTVPAVVRSDIQASVMFQNLRAQSKKMLGDDYQEVRTTSYVSHALLVGATSTIIGRKAETGSFFGSGETLAEYQPQLGDRTNRRSNHGLSPARLCLSHSFQSCVDRATCLV